MNLTSAITKRLLKRKIATILLVSMSIAAFATLGDGGKKGEKGALKTTLSYKNFSLRTGYNYKSNNLLTTQPRQYIQLNTVVTYQKGNSTYVLPMKKKMLLDKVKFNPAQ
jgi:hypothetical protein